MFHPLKPNIVWLTVTQRSARVTVFQIYRRETETKRAVFQKTDVD